MGMQIKDFSDKAFSAYGKVITGLDVTGILKEMEHTPLPDDVIYVPSVPELEALPEALVIQNNVYGELPIQIGYCNGHNTKLNAVEYHRNSEINIAVTDLVLIIGKQQDIGADYTSLRALPRRRRRFPVCSCPSKGNQHRYGTAGD